EQWDKWAVDRLIKDRSGILGKTAAGFASVEYALLEKFFRPVESNYRKLTDQTWVQKHPVARFGTGIQLAADVVGGAGTIGELSKIKFLIPASASLKLSLARDVPFWQRLRIFQTGESWAETRTYLPFGFDRLYPASRS